MTVLEELIYYCNDPNPQGALLLTGEWGCGKSYFVNNTFKESIKDGFIVVKSSLFGIKTIEELHKAVKQNWIDAVTEYYTGIDKKKHFNLVENARKVFQIMFVVLGEILPGRIPFQKIVQTVDVMDLLSVKNEIDNKRTVLIFDDLERCTLDFQDLFGCINDYCENRRFHTIIVANESKILEQNGTVAYRTMKEKTIQRTVKFKTDYQCIIDSIVGEYGIAQKKKEENELYLSYQEYGQFLDEQKEKLYLLFQFGLPICLMENIDFDEKKLEKRAESYELNLCNLRSFKQGIHEFYRVYRILKDSELSNIESYFHSFIMFVMSYYADGNRLNCNRKELFEGKLISKYYLGEFRNDFLLQNAIEGIVDGVWNEEAIELEVKEIEKRYKPWPEIKQILRLPFLKLEEKTIEKAFGLTEVLAHQGTLTLNEYINFIEFINEGHSIGYQFPTPIDWNGIENGIRTKMCEMIKEDIMEKEQYFITTEKYNELFSDERKAYDLILNFRKRNICYRKYCKRVYLEEISTITFWGFEKSSSLYFHEFDEEMAAATVIAYFKLPNSKKDIFVIEFEQLWKFNVNRNGIWHAKNNDGLKTMIDILEFKRNELEKTKGKEIELYYTTSFIESVKNLFQINTYCKNDIKTGTFSKKRFAKFNDVNFSKDLF